MPETITWDDVSAFMGELRRMARGLLGLENNAQTLTPTALVNTALRRQAPEGKLWDQISWKDRSYFLGAMYRAMRRALIDHARGRGGKNRKAIRPVQVEDLQLDDIAGTARDHPEQIDALLLALERLGGEHSEWAEMVEHRYFSGYTIEETARIMGVAEVTVRRHWERARAYLHREVLRILTADGGEEVP